MYATLGQRVFEHVGQFGQEALLIDEFEGFEFLKIRFDTLVDVGHALEQAVRKLPTDDRRELQRLLGCLRQAVNACHEDILDGVGNHNLLQRPSSAHSAPPAAVWPRRPVGT